MTYLHLYKFALALSVGTVLLASAAISKADTLVCERYDTNTGTTIIFSYTEVSVKMPKEDKNPSDIINVTASSGVGFSYIQYRSGYYMYLNAATITCHRINGKGDDIEARITEDFINTITDTGGGLE